MDAAQALTELMQISTQVEAAVILDESGAVVVSSPEGSSSDALASATTELVTAASDLGSGQEATRVEVELESGAVFVLSEGGRTVAARTGPEPSAGLVVYDLRTCLRSIEDEPKRKRAPRKSKKESAEEASDPGESDPGAGSGESE